MAFNWSDWTNVGWAHYLEGFTLFYRFILKFNIRVLTDFFCSGTYDDDTLESSKSVLMNNVNYGVPIVSLRQRSIHRLGLDQKEKNSICISKK